MQLQRKKTPLAGVTNWFNKNGSWTHFTTFQEGSIKNKKYMLCLFKDLGLVIFSLYFSYFFPKILMQQ